MITQVSGMPGSIIGFEISGVVTARDYEDVVIPAINAAASESSKLRLFYHVTPAFESFDLGAMWNDAKVGLEHLANWEKIAVVTDVGWIRSGIKVFGFAVPGEVCVFDNAERDAAMIWLKK
jgi:hypothetical protein